jgi:hypothetical protein
MKSTVTIIMRCGTIMFKVGDYIRHKKIPDIYGFIVFISYGRTDGVIFIMHPALDDNSNAYRMWYLSDANQMMEVV